MKYKDIEEMVLKLYGENKNVMEHNRFYELTVYALGLEKLIELLPTKDIAKLTSEYKKDNHLNTIPIREWDLNVENVKRLLVNKKVRSFSISQCVCILKATARLYIGQGEI
jgi:hypothetical protein